METNPFNKPFNTPFDTIPFDKIEAAHFEPAIKSSIAKAKKTIKKITKDKSQPSIANTLVPLEIALNDINRIATTLYNIDAANTTPSIQKTAQKISLLVTQFTSKILVNKKIFKRVKFLYNHRSELANNYEDVSLIEETYQQMARNGILLKGLRKLRLVRTKVKLSALTLKFNDNILAETNAYYLHLTKKEELEGLPQYVIDAAEIEAEKKEKKGWVFTLKYPSFAPFLKFSSRRDLREKMYMAFSTRGIQPNNRNNEQFVKQIVTLRMKLANLLGFPDYASYVLDEQMAGDSGTVFNFIDQLHEASMPVAQKEVDDLNKFAAKLGFNDELKPWDYNFFSEKLKNEKFGFNEEVLKPYFQMEHVVEGVLNLATKLYGTTFKRLNNIPIYHKEVETYQVLDQNGTYLAILYLDLFPRESKQSGAWMTDYNAQHQLQGENIRPHISICCNFTRPTRTQPALLTFQEVTTLLHEFGHALHGIFANTIYPSLSGTNVYRDFVELPSQLLENWAFEKEWIDTFARHYKTNEPIPCELVQQLIDARNFHSGYASERQLTYGLLDMAWHTLKKPFTGLVRDFEKSAIKKTQLLNNAKDACISTSFSHIFAGGYAAGYYGYKWAEVLDADAFASFKDKGIFNTETATQFRKEILEKGGTKHPMELYVNFKGEKPKIEALLEREGLIINY